MRGLEAIIHSGIGQRSISQRIFGVDVSPHHQQILYDGILIRAGSYMQRVQIVFCVDGPVEIILQTFGFVLVDDLLYFLYVTVCERFLHPETIGVGVEHLEFRVPGHI